MAGTVDFIFLIDGTGSMGSCMRALKDNISVFFDGLNDVQSPVTDWRGKVVVYRDQEVDGSGWLEDNPFVSNDGAALKSQLERMEAGGGGDEPESALDALHMLSTMPQADQGAQEVGPDQWRYRRDAARVVVLFTDASFKSPMTYPEGAGGTVEDVQNALVNNKIILIMYAPDTEGWEAIASTDKSEWIVIPEDPTFVQGLVNIASDSENFKKAMLALAKSMSKSAAPEIL